MAPEVCPNCGAEVPPKARVCPECGSCDETGWSEEAETTALGLPSEEFNYNDFVKREFGDSSPKPPGMKWQWWVVGIALTALLIFLAFHR